LIKLFQYIRLKRYNITYCLLHCFSISEKKFTLNNCWIHCVSLLERTEISSHIFGYTVSVYWTQYFFLAHSLLHCTSILETTLLHTPTLSYTVSVYQTQLLYPHPLLATLFQVKRGINIKQPLLAAPWQRQEFYPQKLLAAMFQYIRDNIFNFRHFWLHNVRISDTTISFSHIMHYTLSVDQNKTF